MRAAPTRKRKWSSDYDVIRKLAIALGVSADLLVFDKDEREPRDELKRQFEALSQFDEEEVRVAKAVLESLILKHNAKRAFVDDLRQVK
ncbi:MAG: XRE family transcriptional regulator [Hahellaceae bacterium]|nr:XRE family transcriptional regulator [Hahellaceae bacterium]